MKLSLINKTGDLRMTKIACLLLIVVGMSNPVNGQLLVEKKSYSKQDTLRGSIGPGRLGWDVLKYDITVKPDYNARTIAGKNIITYYDNGVKLMQIDLQLPMNIDSIISNSKALPFWRDSNVFYTQIRDTGAMYKIKPGIRAVTIYFSGKPRAAKRAPWDGGWVWTKDSAGNPWMSVACQGLGASVWYPCKDIQSDEPDSGAVLRMIVPDSLVAVGNGRLIEKKSFGKAVTQYSWEVKDPINNYNIIPYIGKYVHFGEVFAGEKGKLDMNYWVLDSNLAKAKEQFKQAPLMMKAFEYWFGPYPFYEDGYKLVDAPYLGMEHQSAVAYGNAYKNGYNGHDLSGSGWGLKWDFIIVHESGHEWFANNITSKDIADMWIHEGFTNYSETLFTEYYYGKDAGSAYVQGIRRNIRNDRPIIGPYGVNKEGSGDMYYKSANMLYMIRQIIDNDEKFRSILRGLNSTFYHQTVTTAQVEKYISDSSHIDFSLVFDQYLRTIKIPVLQYKLSEGILSYQWTNCVRGFNMPVKVNFGGTIWLKPTADWQTLDAKTGADTTFSIDPDFYVLSRLTAGEKVAHDQ